MNDHFLETKLEERRKINALRTLTLHSGKVDFCSNDYLGIVKNKLLEDHIGKAFSHGSTGSRLLSGNYALLESTENLVAHFHKAETGLIFNSGYDANVGLLASVPQKGDAIIYDRLSHASIRDGIRLSFANSFSFIHNETSDLEKKLATSAEQYQNIYVVTESVFSMDGDMAPLLNISEICEKYKAALIVDEAHATGVVGKEGEGLVQMLHLEEKCFARVHTFGKACGCHGAVVLGSSRLKQYLINFARSFVYSTAMPPAAAAAISESYGIFPFLDKERKHLEQLIEIFKNNPVKYTILNSITPIQVVVIPGNEEVKKVALNLRDNNFDVRAILYPTVPKGKERLRIVFHSFNTVEEVEKLAALLS